MSSAPRLAAGARHGFPQGREVAPVRSCRSGIYLKRLVAHYTGNNPISRWDPTGYFSCALGVSECVDEVGPNRTNFYYLASHWSTGGGSSLINSREDLNGVYRTYQQSVTDYWKYSALYVTWIDRTSQGSGQGTFTTGEVTFSRTSTDSWTSYQAHSPDSLTEYTEGYRDSTAGPMPEEQILSRDSVVTESYQVGGSEERLPLVAPTAEPDTAGGQVIAEAIGDSAGLDTASDDHAAEDQPVFAPDGLVEWDPYDDPLGGAWAGTYDPASSLRALGFTDEAIGHYGTDQLKKFLSKSDEELKYITWDLNISAQRLSTGEAQRDQRTADVALSTILSIIPWVGDGKDLLEARLGRDFITGDELAGWEVAATVAAAIVPLIPGSVVRKAAKPIVEAVSGWWDEIVDGAQMLIREERGSVPVDPFYRHVDPPGEAHNAANFERYQRDLQYTEEYATRDRIELQDGRIRYYGEADPPRTPGRTVGTAYVHEYDPSADITRGWMESYNANGDVIQVHPKHVNSETVDLPHYMFDDGGEYVGRW